MYWSPASPDPAGPARARLPARQRAADRQGQARPGDTDGYQAGRTRRYVTPGKLAKVEALIAWARVHDVTILDVAIGALAAQPGCSSVIAGATTPEQVKANAAAVEWTPSAEEMAEIDGILPPPAPAT